MARNYDIPSLRRLDVAHHLPAQQDYRLIEELGGSRIVTHADGCYIYDGDGNRILDAMAGLWCVNVGYGRAELAEVARDQMNELSYYNSFFKTANPPVIELAAKLAGLLGGELQHIFFNTSGSEANDTIFRMVRHYWTLKGQPERTTFISRHNAYHGSTVAGASLGGMAFMHAQGGLPIPGIEHIRQPYHFGEGFGTDLESFAEECASALEERILAIGPEKVAAFVAEPIQGAGGVVIPPPGYWPRIEQICRKYGILLVVDEVICGFGRLGAWFGHQYFGFTPDLVSMAKGLSSAYLPISAVAVSSEIVATLKTGGDFTHGFTYSGHPVCAAVSLRNIEILEREGLIARTRDVTGPAFGRALATLADHRLVGEVRSAGLIAGIEIVAEPGTNRRFADKEGTAGPIVRDICIANGLMVRAVRDTLVLCPPLVIDDAQIKETVLIIRKSLDEAGPALDSLFKAEVSA